MADLAALQDVLLQLQALLRIVRPGDVVHAVAVEADRLVGFGVRALLFKQRHRGAVKIGHIGVEHLRRDAILVHDGRIGVALGADVGRLQAERRRRRIADVVHAVAVDTGGHIGIAFLRQCRAVHAVMILSVDRAVALGAGLRHPDARIWQQLLGRRIGQAAHGVRAV